MNRESMLVVLDPTATVKWWVTMWARGYVMLAEARTSSLQLLRGYSLDIVHLQDGLVYVYLSMWLPLEAHEVELRPRAGEHQLDVHNVGTNILALRCPCSDTLKVKGPPIGHHLDPLLQASILSGISVNMTEMGLKWPNAFLPFSHAWPGYGLPLCLEGAIW